MKVINLDIKSVQFCNNITGTLIILFFRIPLDYRKHKIIFLLQNTYYFLFLHKGFKMFTDAHSLQFFSVENN